MYKIAIIDDYQDAINQMKNKIKEFSIKYEIEITCDEYLDSQKFNFHQYYDVIFLDIEMPRLNGFDFAKKINKLYNPKLIFMSNHENNMKHTFDYKPFHYIQKNDFEKSANHVLELLFQSIEYSMIQISYKGIKHKINIHEISYIDIISGIVTIHSYNDKEYNTWESLSSLYKELTNYHFVSISQSTIINLAYVKKVNKSYTEVTLKNDKTFKISTRKRKNFKLAYIHYYL